MKPVLLHLGYPKAASTWLQDVVFPSAELGYWSVFPTKAARIELNRLLLFPNAFDYDPSQVRAGLEARLAALPEESLVPLPIDDVERSAAIIRQTIEEDAYEARRRAICEARRRVIERYMTGKSPLSLVFAVPDHPWQKAAGKAAVRIAMTVAEREDMEARLDAMNRDADL